MKTQMYIWMLLAAVGWLWAQSQNPAVLLQEAQYAQETEGDLDKAIGLYEQVLEQAAGRESLAARATYQLGLCYLARGESRKAGDYFQQVVTFYPDQTALAQQAQAQLAQLRPEREQGLEVQVLLYVQQQHLQAYRKAKEAGLAVRSVAYYVDESRMKVQGGFLTVENDSPAVLDSETAVCRFSQNNIASCYNDTLEPQSFRLEDTGAEPARYTLLWTPDRPLHPGEARVLLYKQADEFLPATAWGCRLEMTGQVGAAALENFFLVLPANLNIKQGLSGLTSHQRVAGFDVYHWQTQADAETANSRVVDIEIEKAGHDASQPVVAATFPAVYANDVPADTNEIFVTFDQDMFQGGWAWVRSGSTENFPEIIGTPRFIDSRTCAAQVQLKPAQTYLVYFNYGKKYPSFRNTDAVPARDYALVFATADEQGHPTEIRPDLLAQAQAWNSQNAIPEPILDIVPPAVRTHIADQFYQTYLTAQEKGLRTNSHVHILDAEWNKDSGLIQIFKNTTDEVIDHEIQMSSNDSPDLFLYDADGERQKIRTYKVPGSNYRYFWTPSAPIEPGEERMLFYSGAGRGRLMPDSENQCTMTMGNHYGSPVIEDFYLVLPAGIELAGQSEPPTRHQTVEGFDVYCWSKEQGYDEQHRVDVKLARR